jgi:SAM-dependent methyltransferase
MTIADRAASFNAVADSYDRLRPRYPEVLFDDLLGITAAGPDARLLEIGAGPGVATLPLARRGLRVVALEPGPSLAAVARRNVTAFPRVEVRQVSFEEASLPASFFDVVVSASAWHWVDPVKGPDLVAEVLKPGGAIALWGAGPRNGDDAFEAASLAVHERWVSNFDPHPMLGRNENIVNDTRFGSLERRSYRFVVSYQTADYLRLLDTYSSYRLLAADTREGLFRDLATLVDQQFGGVVVRSHETSLLVARFEP